MSNKIEYNVDTCPTSEKFQIFRVLNDTIWQILNLRSYYIDDGFEWDYISFQFDDPITAEIICGFLNEELQK